MLPFANPAEMVQAHALMFGAAGASAAQAVLKYAATLFAVPIDPLALRVILAPVEIAPYNKHAGYVGNNRFILGNRHQVAFDGNGELVLTPGFADFIVHELTHIRQAQLRQAHNGERGWAVSPSRGAHRDRGWYSAISEAAPNYLGIAIPQSVWPTGSLTVAGRLTETEMAHWPGSIRQLAAAGDPRLGRPAKELAA